MDLWWELNDLVDFWLDFEFFWELRFDDFFGFLGFFEELEEDCDCYKRSFSLLTPQKSSQ